MFAASTMLPLVLLYLPQFYAINMLLKMGRWIHQHANTIIVVGPDFEELAKFQGDSWPPSIMSRCIGRGPNPHGMVHTPSTPFIVR